MHLYDQVGQSYAHPISLAIHGFIHIASIFYVSIDLYIHAKCTYLYGMHV